MCRNNFCYILFSITLYIQGEATYAKLMDSSQSLVDFMKKEYQDTRR
uniref:Secreted protein n=1 Tax=Angiostrongylus cantonensis TaxID=6313 RepID=A0A0K0D3G6_ANGCA